MSAVTLVILLIFILSIIGALVGVFIRKKHKLFAVAGAITCIIGGYSAWYAAVETRQLIWTIAYAVVAMIGILCFRRHVK